MYTSLKLDNSLVIVRFFKFGDASIIEAGTLVATDDLEASNNVVTEGSDTIWKLISILNNASEASEMHTKNYYTLPLKEGYVEITKEEFIENNAKLSPDIATRIRNMLNELGV